MFRDDEISLLARHLQKMELMSTGVGKRIRCFADCEIFYWHKSLLDTYLSEAHQKHFESSRLEFALAAVSDCKFAILQVIDCYLKNDYLHFEINIISSTHSRILINILIIEFDSVIGITS